MLKILNKREQVILWITAAVIILFFIFKAVVEPVLAKNADLNREVRSTRIKLKKYQILLSQKDYLEKEYARISSGASIIQEGEGASTGILAEIENLAKNANIHIIDIRPQLQKSSTSIRENYIELRALGSMESYLKFIYSIENSLSLLQVKKLQLDAKSNSADLEGTFLISQLNLQ